MKKRMKALEPRVYEIMGDFEQYLKDSALSITHKELIKIRASQLNNCAYCLDLHTKGALKAGENISRLLMLSQWEKVPMFYTEEEQIIFKMTEEISLIQDGLSEDTYDKALALFSEAYIAQIITAIIVINAWNRIGVALEMENKCSL